LQGRQTVVVVSLAHLFVAVVVRLAIAVSFGVKTRASLDI
jgi:hypothetical protein